MDFKVTVDVDKIIAKVEVEVQAKFEQKFTQEIQFSLQGLISKEVDAYLQKDVMPQILAELAKRKPAIVEQAVNMAVEQLTTKVMELVKADQ